jgi:hypothetical protein
MTISVAAAAWGGVFGGVAIIIIYNTLILLYITRPVSVIGCPVSDTGH